MKPKNVIVWILLLGIVVLLMSTSVQAKELTEVNATDILKQIENGEDISLKNVSIIGVFNLTKIELKTVPIARSEWEIEYVRLEEELKIVESEIAIINSIFENDVDSSYTQFRKDIDFSRTTFLSEIDFKGADFTGDANFMDADFTGDADFRYADFSGDADFGYANFSGYAGFYDANFTGDADFQYADFTGDANFVNANFTGNADFFVADFSGGVDFGSADFSGYANFGSADFSGYANFWSADFSGGVDFGSADFSGDPYFVRADFSGDADFYDADFSGDANFWYADFSGDANFRYADFSGDANFEDANFTGDATFHSTEFNKVSFTRSTFTTVSLNESEFNQMKVEWRTLKDVLVFDGLTYIKLIKNFRELEQFEDADAAYYQYRRLSQANKEWSYSKLMDVVAGASCGYGVKPERPLIWAFVLIMVFTLVYWRGKGIKRLKENDGDKNRVSRWAAFYNAFYFSVVTFTTVGYGDWYPEDRYRIVVMIEGVLGWLLLALFIVTLANVMIRP